MSLLQEVHDRIVSAEEEAAKYGGEAVDLLTRLRHDLMEIVGKLPHEPPAAAPSADAPVTVTPAEPDALSADPVPVAEQRAAGVPPEATVTIADQRAGTPPPPEVAPDPQPSSVTAHDQ